MHRTEATKMNLPLLVLAFCLVGCVCDDRAATDNAPSLEDLVKFLGTEKTIWTVLRTVLDTTEGVPYQCVSATKKSVTNTMYQYDECYSIDLRTKNCYPMQASISAGTNAPTINGSTQKGVSNHTYTAVYYHANEECVVLTFERNGQQECEMRVPDDHVRSTDGRKSTDCELAFDKQCPDKPKYMIYDSLCKVLMSQGA